MVLVLPVRTYTSLCAWEVPVCVKPPITHFNPMRDGGHFFLSHISQLNEAEVNYYLLIHLKLSLFFSFAKYAYSM
jgi:hypothetical protein